MSKFFVCSFYYLALFSTLSFAIKCYDGEKGETLECKNGWCSATLYEDGRTYHGCDTLGVCAAIGKSGERCDKMGIGSSCCCDSDLCNKFQAHLCYAGDSSGNEKVLCEQSSCTSITRANGQVVRSCDTENRCPSGPNPPFRDDHCDEHTEENSIYCCCHGTLCNGHEIPKKDMFYCHAGGEKNSAPSECAQGWCTKSVLPSGNVASRACDTNYVCPKIGNKCITVNKGTADESKLCCCDSENCNS
uniref:Uncharacterized protein n=1 Tax=Plectus sambesii TaxID=2011161 RepID=A0A914XIY3_9BILA